jgi:signal transduction histidine kinase
MSRCLFLFLFSVSQLPGLHAQNQSDDALKRQFVHLDSVFSATLTNDHVKSLQLSREQMAIARSLKQDSFLMRALINEGSALSTLGIFDSSLKDLYAALKLAETANNLKIKKSACSYIASIYQSMDDPRQSLEFYLKGKAAALQLLPLEDTLKINSEIGFELVAVGERQKGIDLIKQTLQTARQTGNQEQVVWGLDNLANVYADMGENRIALEYQLESLRNPEGLKDNLIKTGLNEHLSEIYVKLREWDNAQKYQKEALKYSRLIGSNDWLFECYKLQAMIDEGRGDYKSALKNHQVYVELKDSVYQQQYNVKMAAMSSLYELENKEKTISLLEKDKQLAAIELEKQRTRALVLILILLIGSGFLFLYLRIRHQKKINGIREAFSQDLIRTQEAERQRISRELHDSVGQNILFVKNQLQKQGIAGSGDLLLSMDHALEEVRNISKDLYPNQLEKYGLASAVDALAETTSESTGIFVSHDLEGIDEKLNKEARINCYRIIQECLSNALKHAEATAIRITSELMGDRIQLIVQDNGKGFDKSILEKKAHRSFGMINMEERVKMLRGKFDLETGMQKGTKLTFQIPV